MQFHVIDRGKWPTAGAKNTVFLRINNWNDYSFETLFELIAFDRIGNKVELPSVRIGFFGQSTEISTHEKMERSFERLPDEFFSLGVGVDFYRKLFSEFDASWRQDFLEGLRDVVWDRALLERAVDEVVFNTSHLRNITLAEIKDQFASVLSGEVLLTDFDFGFELPASDKFAGFNLTFNVAANSTPSTNMHALIGRNGVGKTTLLNAMVKAIANTSDTSGRFFGLSSFGIEYALDEEYFRSLVSVAFSVFDPFDLPAEDGSGRYTYIGMTDLAGGDGASLTKSKDEILLEFIEGLIECFKEIKKKDRWIQAIKTLESDENFAEMDLISLSEYDEEELKIRAEQKFAKMSSGHSIVILTMTLLVAKIEEKTLVLFDEPEGHLHPPLLSALMRSLGQLLRSRNAVAIIATHSPVVLQEVPRSCVWKIFRARLASEKKRPDTETFGENVGVLTREVFGLEVERSGYHTVMAELVDQGGSYEEILKVFDGRLGNEARGILRAMVLNRDEAINSNA